MTREERRAWLIGRQSSIGSSDAPNLCGVGFRTAADVYRSKTLPVTESDVDGRGILKRGQMLEPLVAQEYSEVMGIDLIRAPWMRNPERPWQSSSPDFMFAHDPMRKVETKTVAGFGDKWGGSGTDDFPEGYRVQCQHQMGVEGLELIDLAALDVITWELRIYRLEFNREFFEWLTSLEREAWDMIERRDPIGPEWEQQWKEQAQSMIAIHRDNCITIPEEFAAVLERRRKLKEIRDEADEAYKSLTQAIYEQMGSSGKATCAGWTLSQWEVRGHIVEEHWVDPFRNCRANHPREGGPAKSRVTKREKVFK